MTTRITISQAAQVGYASRPTIYRKIKDGQLDVFNDGGVKLVDVPQLISVFGEPGGRTKHEGATHTDLAAAQQNEELQARVLRLEADVREARDRLDEKDRDATRERDRLLSQLEEASKRLVDLREDHRGEQADKEATSRAIQELRDEFSKKEKPRGFRAWLLGKD
jgi:hypothetical protein